MTGLLPCLILKVQSFFHFLPGRVVRILQVSQPPESEAFPLSHYSLMWLHGNRSGSVSLRNAAQPLPSPCLHHLCLREAGEWCLPAQNNFASRSIYPLGSNQGDRNHATHFFRNCFPQGIGSKEASSHYLDLDERRQKLGLLEPRSSQEGPCRAGIQSLKEVVLLTHLELEGGAPQLSALR